jgi:AbrB family looped-hinge helix DNA binding protein
MKSIVSEKGQVTIPKELRERLGLGAGQVPDFRERNGRLIGEKMAGGDAVSTVYGILQLGRGTDSLMRELRGGAGPQ